MMKNNKYESFLFYVEGNSMQKLLKEGDVVVVKSQNKYKVGDLIVFDYKGEKVIHRIIFNGIKHVVQAGDNSVRCSVIKKSDIIGKAIQELKTGKQLDNKTLNKRIARNNLKLLFLLYIFKSRLNIIRKKRVSGYYLNLMKKRNELQNK